MFDLADWLRCDYCQLRKAPGEVDRVGLIVPVGAERLVCQDSGCRLAFSRDVGDVALQAMAVDPVGSFWL